MSSHVERGPEPGQVFGAFAAGPNGQEILGVEALVPRRGNNWTVPIYFRDLYLSARFSINLARYIRTVRVYWLDRIPRGMPRDTWILHGLGVVESARRKGVGSRLVEACLRHLEDREASGVHLFASAEVRPFYERNGFTVTCERTLGELQQTGFYRAVGNPPQVNAEYHGGRVSL